MSKTATARTALVLAGAAAMVMSLAACSSSGTTPDKGPSAKPSASATTASDDRFSTPPADIEKVTATCDDGKATIDQSNVDVSLGDCASVTVVASNSVVHLGAVESLVVSGSINDVAAGAVGTTSVTGNGNRVTTDGDTKRSDTGDDNVLATR